MMKRPEHSVLIARNREITDASMTGTPTTMTSASRNRADPTPP
jgi:hypothetical protein